MRNLGRTGVLIDELSRFYHRAILFWCVWRSPTPPNSSGKCRNMDSCCDFRAVAAREKYPGLTLFDQLVSDKIGHGYWTHIQHV